MPSFPELGALGYVMQVNLKEEKYLNTKAELHDMIVGLLGGRANAEELKFETVRTGASDDIERATAIARNMVTPVRHEHRFGPDGPCHPWRASISKGRAVLNSAVMSATAVDEEVRRSHGRMLQ